MKISFPQEKYTQFFNEIEVNGLANFSGLIGVGLGGDASPYDLPERVTLDAQASRARRVGASVA
jgi:hypothetical protein